MKRLLTHFVLALLLVVGFSSGAAAAGSAIAEAMNDLRWGMSEHEVTFYLSHRIKALYEVKMKKASAMEKGRLEQEARSRFQDIKNSRVEFDGRRTRWDSGLIAYEFTHNNDESMLVASDDNSTNFYFFINNSLWKWFKTYDRDAFRGKNFNQVSTALEKKFGRGFRKQAESIPGAGMRPVVEWRDRNTRLRAVDQTGEHGRICLVFEDSSIIGQLSSLRANPDKRLAKLRAAPAKKKVDEADSDQAYETVSSKDNGETADTKSRKSVFAHEARSETDEEYEARRQRVLDQRAEAQRKKHEREMAAKRAKALEGLKDLEDNDPLSGL
ncbi:MAG: hypothetical protein JXA30_04185 [Deltaproteobacteria bacterium]|nr:hypothetical protein [Deltaproteobacteria bacterium]